MKTHPKPKHQQGHCCNGHTQNTSTPTTVTNRRDTHHTALTQTQFYIKEMDCPVEQNLIQKKLTHYAEIAQVEYNLLQRSITVQHQINFENNIIEIIHSLGFSAEITPSSSHTALTNNPLPTIKWFQALLAICFAGAAEITHWLALPFWITLLCAAIAILCSGISVYKKGVIALLHAELNINSLMSIAVSGAMLLNYWPEAAMVMALFNIAEILESRSLFKAQSAIASLLQLTPPQARVKQNGQWIEKAVSELVLGDILLIRPGEIIPVDGYVTAGSTSIDQSSITGESIPVTKQLNALLYSGTLNQLNAIEMQVTATVNDSTLANIVKTVESAQQRRAPSQKFIDRFARIYTPIVVILALCTAIFPPLILQQAWDIWLYRGLTLLIIACPCALVISTPVTIISALTKATQHGILIKGGNYLELIRQIQWLALDKTGTLTTGKPQQTDFISFDKEHSEQQQRILFSLSQHSDHPISKAISATYQNRSALEVKDFQAVLGKGITGVIEQQTYYLGNRRYILEYTPLTEPQLTLIQQLENEGKTVVLLLCQQQLLAICAVADQLKPSSVEALSRLSKQKINTMMLSGDNVTVAQSIAHHLNISAVKANLLPEEKLTEIDSLAQQGKVAMVGDGINDAPALARADISIAMGHLGSDVAINTANIVLMNDDLTNIPYLIALSNKTHRILIQNIFLALGLKLLFGCLTMVGFTGMWMAVLADVGVSLLVIMNGLRLLR